MSQSIADLAASRGSCTVQCSMIRLRHALERGSAHPLLGPILLLMLAFVAVMVYFHATHDGHETAAGIGMLCLGIVTLLGPVLLIRTRRAAPPPLKTPRGDRGPPRRLEPILQRPRPLAPAALSLPLLN